MPGTLQARDLIAAAEAAMQAADAEGVQAERQAVTAIAAHQETIRIGLMNARHQRLSQTPHAHERLPFRVDGEDFGHIAARIPQDEFFHLMQQKNFGYEGFLDRGGLNDFLKTRPACRVKTISGKTTVPVAWDKPKRQRVQFGRGTLNLAT